VRDAIGQTFRAWRTRAAELKQVLSIHSQRERGRERQGDGERARALARERDLGYARGAHFRPCVQYYISPRLGACPRRHRSKIIATNRRGDVISSAVGACCCESGRTTIPLVCCKTPRNLKNRPQLRLNLNEPAETMLQMTLFKLTQFALKNYGFWQDGGVRGCSCW
jgi:hypothetical protein